MVHPNELAIWLDNLVELVRVFMEVSEAYVYAGESYCKNPITDLFLYPLELILVPQFDKH